MVNPHPMMNSPNRNISYVLELAAGIKRKAPIANTSSPVMTQQLRNKHSIEEAKEHVEVLDLRIQVVYLVLVIE